MLDLQTLEGLIFFFLACRFEVPVYFNKSPHKATYRIWIKAVFLFKYNGIFVIFEGNGFVYVCVCVCAFFFF